MTGQDPRGEPWSTLMHSYVCTHTNTGAHVGCECLQGPERDREGGWVLALATAFVMVTCGRGSSGQETRWEPLCHPSRAAWVTSSYGNNSFTWGIGLQIHCQTTEDCRGAGQCFLPLFPSDGPSEYINLRAIYMHGTVEKECILQCWPTHTNTQINTHSISLTL